jgi:hypothetical protein
VAKHWGSRNANALPTFAVSQIPAARRQVGIPERQLLGVLVQNPLPLARHLRAI